MREYISAFLAERLGLDLDVPHVTLIVTREGKRIRIRGIPEITKDAASDLKSFFREADILRDGVTYVATDRPSIPGPMVLLADSRPVRVKSEEFKVFGRAIKVLMITFVRVLSYLYRLKGFHREVSAHSRERFIRAVMDGREDLLVPGQRVVSICPHCGNDRKGRPSEPDDLLVCLPMEIVCWTPYFNMAAKLFESVTQTILANIEEPQLRRINHDLEAAGLSLRANVSPEQPFDLSALLAEQDS